MSQQPQNLPNPISRKLTSVTLMIPCTLSPDWWTVFWGDRSLWYLIRNKGNLHIREATCLPGVAKTFRQSSSIMMSIECHIFSGQGCWMCFVKSGWWANFEVKRCHRDHLELWESQRTPEPLNPCTLCVNHWALPLNHQVKMSNLLYLFFLYSFHSFKLTILVSRPVW